MFSVWKKDISILVGNLNSGRSYQYYSCTNKNVLFSGLIAVPINCMMSVTGNCSYKYDKNYVLPNYTCRLEKDNTTFVVQEKYASYHRSDFMYFHKGRLSLFNLFIDMRTTVSLSISCGKNVFLLENFNKNTFFLHEMDKLTVVLMSIKWLNKKRWPLVEQH